jgi:predicted DNA-binding antitoxin AbrB/MazE fold protein
MSREEVQRLLISIQSLYPTWKVEEDEMTATINAWHWALEEYPAPEVKAALQMYVKTNNTGFAPSVSQIINGIYKPMEKDTLSEGEAWSLVKRAIQDGNYHAEERYNELPPLVQKAVGSPNMIHQWAGTESDEVNTVIMSNFQRAYKTIVHREQENVRINPVIAGLVEATTQKMIGGELND